MASSIPIDLRNKSISIFREQVMAKWGAVPFLHQREVWAAGDGLVVLPVDDPSGVLVNLSKDPLVPDIRRWMVAPRPEGQARFLTDLGAFKVGKSFGAAGWGTGFAVVPQARIKLVGLEYDICEPEFSYIADFLLSERGMNLKFKHYVNRPKEGKMFLELENGCRYEARSWERKDTLKGKEDDAYIYCEAYQLPGIECFTGFSQNLRVRKGFAYFATTPDRPWVMELHKLAGNHHGPDADPEWHCVCGVGAEVNPFSFDQKAKDRDRKLMTREKFQIHYEGKLGEFVGRVFNYQQGQRQFTAESHPHLFEGGAGKEHFTIPQGWAVLGGGDTGTFYTGLQVTFDPEGNAYVFDEFPNYSYTAGSPERDPDITIPWWSRKVVAAFARVGLTATLWADSNSQFKAELRNYGVHLLPSTAMRETRTEITREYFQHNAIFFAPWLKVLPFELENATWPEEPTAGGRFERLKDRDHTLDCLEHVLARRPRGGRPAPPPRRRTWAESFAPLKRTHNPHLGGR